VTTVDYRQKLLDVYQVLPFHEHPLWKGILSGTLSFSQIIQAEVQHYLRTKAGQSLRKHALDSAKGVSEHIFARLLETYLEECTQDASGPSHLELIRRLVVAGGVTEQELSTAINTPGNAAAIALYKEIGDRGSACHMIGAGVVEHYYAQLTPKIFTVYTSIYGMDPQSAETYSIHGEMDIIHAARAFDILEEALDNCGWSIIELSVRDALVATSLHYDGMLQAATGEITYWNGR